MGNARFNRALVRNLVCGGAVESMKYGSVCSGIEAASVAWHPLGWRASFLSEIEAFPRAVLSHHYPKVPLHGDFTTIRKDQYEPIDLLVGGTPCQSFSIAGLRGGLGDDRGNLALEYLRLADRLRPRWLVWENVPGVLSSAGGRDFGAILGGLVELGYGFAYRVLDAQYVRVDGFGRAVPQRRRRVFVVGHLGDWRRAAAVLFERESLSGNSAPRRQAGQGVARAITAGFGTGSEVHPEGDMSGLVPSWPAQVAPTLNAKFGDKMGLEDQHALNGAGMFVPETFGTLTTRSIAAMGARDVEDGVLIPEVSYTLNAGGQARMDIGNETIVPVAFDMAQITSKANRTRVEAGLPASTLNAAGQMHVAQPIAIQERAICENPNAGPDGAGIRTDGAAYTLEARTVPQAVAFTCSEQANGFAWERDVYGSLTAQIPNDTSNIQQGVRIGWRVRRLTPTECERLQGFPDGYTNIPYRNKNDAPDGPRYKALGNSMAVNAMRWIGRRIEMVDAMETTHV